MYGTTKLAANYSQRGGILFNEEDLIHDMGKHASDFGIGTEEEYVKKARSFIKNSDKILAKTFKGEVQFLFLVKMVML